MDAQEKGTPAQSKQSIFNIVSNALKPIRKILPLMRLTGIFYILFAALSAVVGIVGLTGADLMQGYLPEGFVEVRAFKSHILPEGVLPQFFFILVIFAVYRLVIGCLDILLGKLPEKGGFLGLLGKIDLWLVILITVFATFFIDGFSFIWFPLISFIPAMLQLHGTAKLDNRPGISTRAESRAAKVFLIPAFLGLIFITYIPLLAVFGISLFDLRAVQLHPEFVGLNNYVDLFTTNPFFWDSLRVTVVYAFVTVGLGMVYSMVIALLLNRKMPGRTFFRTVFYLPYIIPAVSSLMIFRLIYTHGGILNNIINMFGGDRVHFLMDDATIIPALAVIAVWTSGNVIVIKMAGLNNVPRVYHEAGEIDGANAWQRFWKITIPVMSPIIFYNMLMSLITHMQVVVPSLIMTGGGQAGVTVIQTSYRFIAYEMYTTGLAQGFFGRGGAYSFVLFVIVGIFTAILFASSKKWLFYEGGGPK